MVTCIMSRTGKSRVNKLRDFRVLIVYYSSARVKQTPLKIHQRGEEAISNPTLNTNVFKRISPPPHRDPALLSFVDYSSIKNLSKC